MAGFALKGALSDQQLTIIENGGIYNGRWKNIFVGPYAQISEEANQPKCWEFADRFPIWYGFRGLLMPQPPTFAFGGQAGPMTNGLRNSGKTYLELPKAGGGSWARLPKPEKPAHFEPC